MFFRQQGLVVALLLFLSGTLLHCGSGATESETTGGESEASSTMEPSSQSDAGIFNADHYGAYADDSYAQRGEGYDWVGVRVQPFSEQQVRVSVRSRADKKRPTCTLDVLANVQDANTLQVYDGQNGIQFAFSGDQLTISAPEGQRADGLAYYCSGGGTIAGTYGKIDGPLDPDQVDQVDFTKALSYGDMMVYVEAQDGELTVRPTGLSNSNEPMIVNYQGEVIDAEISDITGDNHPEVAVYTRDGEYGNAHVFTSLGGRSMVPVYLPDISGNDEASAGYAGKDEFRMVENTLVRRFPVEGGGTRQLQYKISAGENMPQLTIDRISEY